MKRVLKWGAVVVVALIAVLGLSFLASSARHLSPIQHGAGVLKSALGAVLSMSEDTASTTTLLDRAMVQSWFWCTVSEGTTEDWEKLAPYLAKAGYRIYLRRSAGFGQSEKPANFSYSISDEAKIVDGFFEALKLKQVDLAVVEWADGSCRSWRHSVLNGCAG